MPEQACGRGLVGGQTDPSQLEREQSRPGGAWNLVHDGCRHALPHMHGINPGDVWLRPFE